MELVPPTAENVARAAARLRAGGVVGMPTETVYGLAASARDGEALARVFDLKGRPRDHPLIVHLAAFDGLSEWALQPDHRARRLAEAFWPGPLTLVLPRAPRVLDAVTGGQETVAVRVPADPVAQALLREFGGALAAPSANRFGRLSPTTAQHVAAEFAGEDLLVLDGGPCQVGLESTIVDLSGAEPRLLRPGAITREQLAAALGEPVGLPRGPGGDPRAPGSLPSHYAPSSTTVLASSEELPGLSGSGAAVLARSPAPPGFTGTWATLPDEPQGYGAGLYAALRRLDGEGPTAIYVERVPEAPSWFAVRDRLERAAAPRGDAAERARRSA